MLVPQSLVLGIEIVSMRVYRVPNNPDAEVKACQRSQSYSLYSQSLY